MMQEKAMVSDALNSINSGLKTYTDMISQTENLELRSALQQMRNEAEKSQYELYTMAKSLHYYQPAQKANQEEVNNIKSIFSGSTGIAGGAGMSGNIGMSGGSGMSGNIGMSGGSGMSGNSSMSGNSALAGNSGSSGNSDVSGSSWLSGSSGSSGSLGKSSSSSKSKK